MRGLAGRLSLRQGHVAHRHLRAERRDAGWPCLVAKERSEAFSREALLPAPDRGFGLRPPRAGSTCVPSPSGAQQHDLSTPDMLLRRIPVSHEGFEPKAIRGGSVQERLLRIPPDSQDTTQTGTRDGLNRQVSIMRKQGSSLPISLNDSGQARNRRGRRARPGERRESIPAPTEGWPVGFSRKFGGFKTVYAVAPSRLPLRHCDFYFSMTVAGRRITGVRRTIRVLGVRRDRWHGQRRDADPFVQLGRYDNFVSVRSS